MPKSPRKKMRLDEQSLPPSCGPYVYKNAQKGFWRWTSLFRDSDGTLYSKCKLCGQVYRHGNKLQHSIPKTHCMTTAVNHKTHQDNTELGDYLETLHSDASKAHHSVLEEASAGAGHAHGTRQKTLKETLDRKGKLKNLWKKGGDLNMTMHLLLFDLLVAANIPAQVLELPELHQFIEFL